MAWRKACAHQPKPAHVRIISWSFAPSGVSSTVASIGPGGLARPAQRLPDGSSNDFDFHFHRYYARGPRGGEPGNSMTDSRLILRLAVPFSILAVAHGFAPEAAAQARERGRLRMPHRRTTSEPTPVAAPAPAPVAASLPVVAPVAAHTPPTDDVVEVVVHAERQRDSVASQLEHTRATHP